MPATVKKPNPIFSSIASARTRWLIVALCLGYLPQSQADPVATVTAFEPNVWIDRVDSKTLLGLNSDIEVGDRIVTDTGGRVDAVLVGGVELVLNSDSEIELKPASTSESGILPDLQIDRGSACIAFKIGANRDARLKLNVGNVLFAVIQSQGRVCAHRRGRVSSISLREGSVQVTQSVDPNMIIISEVGTEFRVDDNGGSYQLLFPGSDDSLTQYDETPVITAIDATVDSQAASLDSGVTPTQAPTKEETPQPAAETPVLAAVTPAPEADSSSSEFVYTVYLFSARSEEVAKDVNDRFRTAGYQTIVLASAKGSGTRYRVAVSDFKSHSSAQEFADAIVGKHGISDTWIGRDRKTRIDAVLDSQTASSDSSAAPPDNSTASAGVAPLDPPATEVDTPAPAAETDSPVSEFIYTVYLFSTRSEEVANDVNNRFRSAGYQTIVLTSAKDSVSSYRVAVSNFETRESAQDFADSIVGKHGISDTWIGKDNNTKSVE